MNKCLPLTFCLLAASVTPVVANASSAHVGYESVSISSVSLTGLSASGSLDISDDISLELWSGSADTTVSGIKVELAQTDVGIGYNTKLGDALDLKVFAVHVNQTLTASWSGYVQQIDFGAATGFGASIKAELTDNVDGLLGFRKLNRSDSTLSTMFGISVGVSNTMDLTVSSTGNSTLKRTTIGLRYNF